MRGPSTNGSKNNREAARKSLFGAIAKLRNVSETERFFIDLATPAEIDAFAERWRIAQLLDAGELSYREIAEETGASTATIGRVARFLRQEPHRGYRIILDRL